MMGGTLVLSKAVKLHSHFKKRFEQLGFNDVAITSVEKDGLYMMIRDTNPRLLLVGSSFYKCCTPYMMAEMHRNFPKLNIAAISLSDYPADLAMYFIANGVKSYANFWEGAEEFYKGLEEIRRGREYISPEVRKRINMRGYEIQPSGILTRKQTEIVRLVCNGFTGIEIADVMHVSKNSVDNRKSEIYMALNVRNENELIRAALFHGIIKVEELNFFAKDYVLRPLPEDKYRGNK